MHVASASFATVVLLLKCQPDYLAQNNVLTKRDSSWWKIYKVLQCSCSPFVISKVLAARMRKLITTRARKNKRTACMLANAGKDHLIPLSVNCDLCSSRFGHFNHLLLPRGYM